MQLAKAHCELNKRIHEHDRCMAEGKTDKQEVTLQVHLIIEWTEMVNISE